MSLDPRIHFYCTPRSSEHLERFYVPPFEEAEYIKKFNELGYATIVDTERTSTQKNVSAIKGIVIYHGENFFRLCSEPHEGNVFLLIYFVTHVNLEAAKIFFSDLLGLQLVKRVLFTRAIQRLLDNGAFRPSTPQTLLESSKRPDYQYKLDDGRIVTVVKGGEYSNKVEDRIRALQQTNQFVSTKTLEVPA